MFGLRFMIWFFISVLSSFTIISLRKEEWLLTLCSCCRVYCLCSRLFLAMPWAGFLSLSVLFPGDYLLVF